MRLLLSAALCASLCMASPAVAQDPVADRAVAAAKEYVKAKGLKDPKLTILLSSLYNNSFPDFAKKWEELTGVKFEIVPLGYTDIPAKIMQESVSKTGVYDIFNDFPYTMPDAAGAKVIIPLDDFARKYQPDFSGIADGLKFQQYYDGKLLRDGQRRRPPAAGAAQRPDGEPAGQRRVQGQARQGPRLPRHGRRVGAAGRLLPDEGGRHALGHQIRERPLGRSRLSLGQLLLPALPALHEGASVRQGHEAAHHDAGRHPGHQGLCAPRVEYMPKDIQGWGTPQIYPYWGSGQAYSAVSFPSIFGFGESNPNSVVKGKQLACLIPGQMVDGKLVRRSPQAAGTGYMVSAYAKNPELAYLFIQWFTSPSIGDDAVAHPKGFWDPFRLLEPDAQGHPRSLWRGHGQDDDRELEVRGVPAADRGQLRVLQGSRQQPRRRDEQEHHGGGSSQAHRG